MQTKWQYTGDTNLEHGGTFCQIDPQEWEWGYCTAVRVTDLDSATGFDGAVLIEHVTILTDKVRWQAVLDYCGWTVVDILNADPDDRRIMLAEALLAYGYYDPDDAWAGYTKSHMEAVQTQPDGPMEFDGWKADKRVLSENLEGYIRAEHLGY